MNEEEKKIIVNLISKYEELVFSLFRNEFFPPELCGIPEEYERAIKEIVVVKKELKKKYLPELTV